MIVEEGYYSVHQLAELSGISVRTLHHYDQIGLLVSRREANGYRVYGPQEVRRLQHILLYRSCGLQLKQIKSLLDASALDDHALLVDQLARLENERTRLDAVISTLRRTIAALERGDTMTDAARFEGLKQQVVGRNEREYGKEARARYGDKAVDQANAALMAMDEKAWNDMAALEAHIKELLSAALAAGDTAGAEARELVRAHARWLQLHWGAGAYSPEAHRNLADGYLADERFVAYYDGACGTGATQFLRDAIWALV